MGGRTELEHVLLCLNNIIYTPSSHTWRSPTSVSPKPDHSLLGGFSKAGEFSVADVHSTLRPAKLGPAGPSVHEIV